MLPHEGVLLVMHQQSMWVGETDESHNGLSEAFQRASEMKAKRQLEPHSAGPKQSTGVQMSEIFAFIKEDPVSHPSL